MDTTENYIKMCEKAEEIQGLRKRISEWDSKLWMFNEDGDFIANAKLVGKAQKAIRTSGAKNSPKLVWLPRQDQLQEMVEVPPEEFPDGTEGSEEERQLGYLLSAPYEIFIDNYYPERYLSKFTSMEQLWLAFVMKEKYGKTWNGEDWVKK